MGERLPYKQNVGGSSPSFRTKIYKLVPKTGIKKKVRCGRDAAGLYIYHLWVSRIVAIAGDCKSLAEWLRWFESNLAHHMLA